MKLYFHFFGKAIPAYSTMAALGLVVSLLVAAYLCRKKGIPVKELFSQAAYGGLFMVLFAKLFYALPFLPVLLKNLFLPEEQRVHPNLFAGYVFYGGLLGLLFGTWLYHHLMHHTVLPYFDIVAVVIPLFHAFGRLGCYFAGCCYGVEYHGIFALQFPVNALEPGIENVTRFPVQPAECVFNLLLFAVLLWKNRKNDTPGKIISLYLMAYPMARFLLEFFRGDEIRGIFSIGKLSLSSAQIISLILFPIVCQFYYRLKNQK